MQRAQDLLQTAAKDSEDLSTALAGKWEQILTLTLAHELLEGLEDQKRACDAIQETQDAAARQLTAMLSQQDEEFEAVLKLQAAEQEVLLRAFSHQEDELHEACMHELRTIELALQQV